LKVFIQTTKTVHLVNLPQIRPFAADFQTFHSDNTITAWLGRLMCSTYLFKHNTFYCWYWI